MDAIAAALAVHSPLTDLELLLETLRRFLGKPRLSNSGVARELAANSSLESAYGSALGYLQEAEIVWQDSEGGGWLMLNV